MTGCKKTSTLLLLGISLLFLMSLTRCGGGEQGVLVYAAASLRDALTPLVQEYEAEHNVKVQFNWGGSVTLSGQLQRYAPGDLFISAGHGPMDNLEDDGLLEPGTRTTLLTNGLVVVTPSNAEPRQVNINETLNNSGRIALGHPKLAPAGLYAEEALRSLGLLDGLQSKLVFGGDVRAALAYVESGSAGAGIVYVTDALNNNRVRIAHRVPSETHSPIVYPAAVLKASNRQTAALQFLAFLQEESTQAKLHTYGFGVPDRS